MKSGNKSRNRIILLNCKSTCEEKTQVLLYLFNFSVKIRIIDRYDKSEPITDWYEVRIIIVWCGRGDLNSYEIAFTWT